MVDPIQIISYSLVRKQNLYIFAVLMKHLKIYIIMAFSIINKKSKLPKCEIAILLKCKWYLCLQEWLGRFETYPTDLIALGLVVSEVNTVAVQ